MGFNSGFKGLIDILQLSYPIQATLCLGITNPSLCFSLQI